MSDLQEFAMLTKSQKIQRLIIDGDWKAVLSHDGPLDFEWHRIGKIRESNRIVVDHLQSISPVSEREIAYVKFDVGYDPEEIDLRLISIIFLFDKLSANNWPQRWVDRLVHLNMLDLVVMVGNIIPSIANRLLPHIKSYKSIVHMAKMTKDCDNFEWIGEILNKLVTSGDCNNDVIAHCIEMYLLDHPDMTNGIIELAITHKRYNLIDVIADPSDLVTHLADDDAHLLKICFCAIGRNHVMFMCASGWIKCVMHVLATWPSMALSILFYSSYCDDDDKREMLFSLFGDATILIEDALGCISNGNLRPLHRLGINRLPTELYNYLNDDKYIKGIFALDGLDHSILHEHIDDKWIDITDRLDRCCMPYAAINTDEVFYALQDKYGHSAICNFYRACLGKSHHDFILESKEIDYTFLRHADLVMIVNTIIDHHALPVEMLLKFFEDHSYAHPLIIKHGGYKTFEFSARNMYTSDIVILLPFMSGEIDYNRGIDVLEYHGSMAPYVRARYNPTELTKHIMQRDARDAFVVLNLRCDRDNLRLATEYDAYKIMAYILDELI